MKRIVILVNKDFEYKGFIEGLRDTVPVFAGTNGRDAEVRFGGTRADIYCIQHLFKEGENSSNSEEKYARLLNLFRRNTFRIGEIDALLSISTSESTPNVQIDDEMRENSKNGCVYVGHKLFMSDRRDDDPTTRSNLRVGTCASAYSEYYHEKPIRGLYYALEFVNMKLRTAFNRPAEVPRCYADSAYTCVGVTNVMDYKCYGRADEHAYSQFLTKNYARSCTPVCIETTHGVVVKAFNAVTDEFGINKEIPFSFVSPIVDRYMKFDDDVDGNGGKQNFICSYNGGVVSGHIIGTFDAIYGGDKK